MGRLTQPIQPTLHRQPRGIRAHIVAGIVFALLFVVLVNVRPFSAWVPVGTTLNFAVEIVSPGDGGVQVARTSFGGTRMLPAGRVPIAKSGSPRPVLMKVRAEDCGSLLFQTTVTSGTMELHHPRIQDDDGRVLHRFDVAKAKPMAD